MSLCEIGRTRLAFPMKVVISLLLCVAAAYSFCAWFGADESPESSFSAADRRRWWTICSPAPEHQPYRGPMLPGPKIRGTGESARVYQVIQPDLLRGAL